MVELKILSGKQAGQVVLVRRFPFLVGRGSRSGLALEDEGVFEKHFEVRLEPRDGFLLFVQPGAYTSVNGQTVQQHLLKAGDVISAGSAKLTFTLAPAAARSLRTQELLIWAGLVLLCLVQVALVYALG